MNPINLLPGETNTYKYPINSTDSLFFKVSGNILKAELYASNSWGDTLLGTLAPTNDELNFFDERPFHAGLVNSSYIKVYTEKCDTIPSITYISADKCLTRDSVPPEYIEAVTVNSSSGKKEMTIVYVGGNVGFRRK